MRTAKGAVRQFRLTVVDRPARGATWQSTTDRCSIGSHIRNDLIVEDPTVSRFYCESVVDESGVRVRDLKSRNGTVAHGVAIVDAFVRVRSIIRSRRPASTQPVAQEATTNRRCGPRVHIAQTLNCGAVNPS